MPEPSDPLQADSLHAKSLQAEPDQAGVSITPVDFTPLGQGQKRLRGKRPLLWPLSIVCLLITVLILWFLNTARTVIIEVKPEAAVLSTELSSPDLSSLDLNIDGGFNIHLADRFLIRSGSYQLSATAEGYQHYQQPLQVDDRDSQRHLITLIKQPGQLKITTQPAEASVSIDGKEQGKTPLTAKNLTPGQHQIKFSHPRYLAVEQTRVI